MSRHTAVVHWQRQGAVYTDNKYSRGHLWQFDGGVEVPASASPQVVPLPLSVAAAVDPEEAFVVSLSSCHMLWFLSLAAKQGWVVEDYRDVAEGRMARDESGKTRMIEVVLRPVVTFAGKQPEEAQYQALHHEAHEECFLARSVKAEVRCEAVVG